MPFPHVTCTVVIPCFNAEPYLEAAVNSVFSQSFQDFHLVLVDDASQDKTRALAHQLAEKRSNVTILELPENRGRCFARNKGTEVTCGPYVSFLDQDDTLHPDFLRTTTAVLSQHPHFDAAKVFPSISIEIDPAQYKAVASSLATTMLIRRPSFEFVGGWPESMIFRQHPGGCEDIAFQRLFSFCFKTAVINSKLYNYSHRPGNALDRFLSRSRVVQGKLRLQGGEADDQKVMAEIRSLTEFLRQRVRDFIREGLGSNKTYPVPTNRNVQFVRLGQKLERMLIGTEVQLLSNSHVSDGHPPISEQKNLAALYTTACNRPSDISEHCPTLYALARECRHITEMGTRTANSTTAFLFAQPLKLVCYDTVKFPQVDVLSTVAGATEFVFHQADVLKIEIEPTDLLFIDTWHVYEQLSEELRLHAGKARKYIVMHDTTTFGEQGETSGHRGLWPAIEEFLAQGTFRLKERFTNNNGLTILERK